MKLGLLLAIFAVISSASAVAVKSSSDCMRHYMDSLIKLAKTTEKKSADCNKTSFDTTHISYSTIVEANDYLRPNVSEIIDDLERCQNIRDQMHKIECYAALVSIFDFFLNVPKEIDSRVRLHFGPFNG